jgi:hypothetical protein
MTTEIDFKTYFKNLDVKMDPSTQKIWDLIEGQLLACVSEDTLAEEYAEYYCLRYQDGEPYGAYCLRYDGPQLKEYVYHLVKIMDEVFPSDSEPGREAAKDKREYIALLTEDLFYEPSEDKDIIDWYLLTRKTNWTLTEAIWEDEKRARESEERRYQEEQAAKKQSA